ncbi:MAG: tetratricopeptide repeat protein [Candidatus Rokubacteria bacterium]|nr:tetratricopeptide repeat protein [Candidatus Rokubacteria bacterium]
MSVRGAAVFLVVLALVALVAAAPEQAALLEKLRSGSPEERRAAAARLAEIGDTGATADLAKALRDPDSEVRERAQAGLWAIWYRSGDVEVDRLLQRGIVLMEQRRYLDAVTVFSEVISRAPDFAEGWNKRATTYYLMGEFDRSLADCEEVIRRNPIHFGVLSGFGLIYLQKGDLERAAEYFERALTVNPNLETIEAVLEQIREALKQRRRQAI